MMGDHYQEICRRLSVNHGNICETAESTLALRPVSITDIGPVLSLSQGRSTYTDWIVCLHSTYGKWIGEQDKEKLR